MLAGIQVTNSIVDIGVFAAPQTCLPPLQCSTLAFPCSSCQNLMPESVFPPGAAPAAPLAQVSAQLGSIHGASPTSTA